MGSTGSARKLRQTSAISISQHPPIHLPTSPGPAACGIISVDGFQSFNRSLLEGHIGKPPYDPSHCINPITAHTKKVKVPRITLT